jgi:hypothetical protein
MTAAQEAETVQQSRSEATKNNQKLERQMVEVRNTFNHQPQGMQVLLNGYFEANR